MNIFAFVRFSYCASERKVKMIINWRMAVYDRPHVMDILGGVKINGFQPRYPLGIVWKIKVRHRPTENLLFRVMFFLSGNIPQGYFLPFPFLRIPCFFFWQSTEMNSQIKIRLNLSYHPFYKYIRVFQFETLSDFSLEIAKIPAVLLNL